MVSLVSEISFFVQGSPSSGPRGLFLGDLVTQLEDCTVRGVQDWHDCIQHLSHSPQKGYCVHTAKLQLSWMAGRGTDLPYTLPFKSLGPVCFFLFFFNSAKNALN